MHTHSISTNVYKYKYRKINNKRIMTVNIPSYPAFSFCK